MPLATVTSLNVMADSGALTSIALGTGATLTAQTTTTGGQAASGTLQFFDGNTSLGSAISTDSTGSASIDVTTLARGLHSLSAKFMGLALYSPSISPTVSLFVSAGFNAGRVVVGQQVPVLVVGARPGRSALIVYSGAALLSSDPLNAVTSGLQASENTPPMYLPSYDGEMWGLCPGPAHGVPLGRSQTSIYFLEIYG